MNGTAPGPRPTRRLRLTPATSRFERNGWRGQSGAILVLALAFITVIMTLTVALLGLARTENRSLRSYRTERVRRYAIDGALQEAIQFAKLNPNYGVSGGSAPMCHLEHAVKDDNLGGGAGIYPVAGEGGGSYITTDCAATSISGVTSGGIGADGGQDARDITFEVKCNYEPGNPVPTGLLQCGSGTNSVTLARARIRFDIDPTQPATARATVPKVIYWTVRQDS